MATQSREFVAGREYQKAQDAALCRTLSDYEDVEGVFHVVDKYDCADEILKQHIQE